MGRIMDNVTSSEIHICASVAQIGLKKMQNSKQYTATLGSQTN